MNDNDVPVTDKAIKQLEQLAPRHDAIGISAYLSQLIDDEYQKQKVTKEQVCHNYRRENLKSH